MYILLGKCKLYNSLTLTSTKSMCQQQMLLKMKVRKEAKIRNRFNTGIDTTLG